VNWAAYLDSAASDVVRRHEPAGAGRELLLHARLRAALGRHEALHVAAGEGRLEDHGRGWTRPPGAIDIVAETRVGPRRVALGVEVKIRKLDELLWDAIKVAQRCGEKPWPGALAAAALIVELQESDLCHALAVSWFDSAAAIVIPSDAIRRWPKAWYDVMYGGRGIRPTSLPGSIRLGACGRHNYPDGTLLCWRLLRADDVHGPERDPVDHHGFPLGLDYPREWCREIDRAAERRPRKARVTSRRRLTLAEPPRTITVAIEEDDVGRIWADVWDAGFVDPTSFRLVSSIDLRFDARVASNGALHIADPPKPLPAWCRGAVQEVLKA
jgi:hypothetical protein